jgi:2',3'-cyclic-nucleotide 2'-phosphodiesterase (5'-nucleotidase family)
MTEYTRIIGRSLNPLTKIDYLECTIANAITDSMLIGEWKDEAVMAFMNNGGIRSDLTAGDITGTF